MDKWITFATVRNLSVWIVMRCGDVWIYFVWILCRSCAIIERWQGDKLNERLRVEPQRWSSEPRRISLITPTDKSYNPNDGVPNPVG